LTAHLGYRRVCNGKWERGGEREEDRDETTGDQDAGTFDIAIVSLVQVSKIACPSAVLAALLEMTKHHYRRQICHHSVRDIDPGK
jgi:hypothetical protein